MSAKAKAKALQSKVKKLRKQLTRAESKNAKLPVLKAQLKEQAKIIERMEKKVAAYDDLVLEKMCLNETIARLKKQLDDAQGDSVERKRLVQSKKRTEEKLERARGDSVVRKRLVQSKKRQGIRLVRAKEQTKQLKESNKRLESSLAASISLKPGPEPSAYKSLTPSAKWKRSRKLAIAVAEKMQVRRRRNFTTLRNLVHWIETNAGSLDN